MKRYPNPNVNGRVLIDCTECGERKELHAKDVCYKCYKQKWKARNIECKNCKRILPHKALGLCASCHNRLHHYDKVLSYNKRKYFGISLEQYRELTKECIICSFSKIVELHHLDGDKNNNSKENFIALCPNCHKMLHSHQFYKEILQILKTKGILQEGFKPRRL